MSIDPVTTDANTGGSFNRYAYVANNPYKYIDPDGREMIAVTLPGIGRTYLDDAFAKKVDVFIAGANKGGVDIKVNSAYRDQDKQNSLKNDKAAITPAKVSLHSTGNAIDVNYSSLQDVKDGLTGDQQRAVINDSAKDAGLSWGGVFKKQADPPHFYADPGGDRTKKAEQAKKEVDEIKEKEKEK